MDIYNFGLYGTFEPNGMDVLRLYSGKTVIILGNKYPQESGSTSIVDYLDVVEVAKVLAEGTTIFVCDVEKSRMGEMRGWIADVVHGSSIPTIDGFVDKHGLIRCLQAKKDDTRYMLTTKISQPKFADNLLGTPTMKDGPVEMGDKGDDQGGRDLPPVRLQQSYLVLMEEPDGSLQHAQFKPRPPCPALFQQPIVEVLQT